MLINDTNTNKGSVPTDNPIVISSEDTKRKTPSPVWNHFKKRKVDGKDKEECNYCNKLFLGDSKQGTSHLRGHSNRCKRRKFKDIRDLRQ